MASYMDAAVGQIVAALRAKAMWGRTLLLFFADNGGPRMATARPQRP